MAHKGTTVAFDRVFATVLWRNGLARLRTGVIYRPVTCVEDSRLAGKVTSRPGDENVGAGLPIGKEKRNSAGRPGFGPFRTFPGAMHPSGDARARSSGIVLVHVDIYDGRSGVSCLLVR